MRRSYLRVGDESSTGGTVIEGMDDSFEEGIALTFLGAKVVCPACGTTGFIIQTGPRRPDNWMGKEAALDQDLCACKCHPLPVMFASQDSMFEEYSAHELAAMGFGLDGRPLLPATSFKQPMTASSLKETDQQSKLEDHPELICPNMTNAQFAMKVMELRGIVEKRILIRLNELQRWNTQDRRNVETWFGVTDTNTRQTLLDGLASMLRVTKSLTPANFVRWSESALTHVGCVPGRPKGEKRTVVAAVCKPDTETHTIAIATEFCGMRDDWDRGDSRLLTLAHEISHFIDTMDTSDEYYTVWNSISLAKINYEKCLTIADNIAGYIVIHDSFPASFGNFIQDN